MMECFVSHHPINLEYDLLFAIMGDSGNVNGKLAKLDKRLTEQPEIVAPQYSEIIDLLIVARSAHRHLINFFAGKQLHARSPQHE